MSRYPTADASDAAMDAECKAKNVKKNYYSSRPADRPRSTSGRQFDMLK